MDLVKMALAIGLVVIAGIVGWMVLSSGGSQVGTGFSNFQDFMGQVSAFGGG